MAELALVGDGPDMYQIWVGGSSNLTNLASTYANKIKWTEVDNTIEPLFRSWKDNRLSAEEGFGNYCSRVGVANLAKQFLVPK